MLLQWHVLIGSRWLTRRVTRSVETQPQSSLCLSRTDLQAHFHVEASFDAYPLDFFNRRAPPPSPCVRVL